MFKEDYVKESNLVNKTEQEYTEDLYTDLENSKKNLNNLYENLNYASRKFG